MSYPTPPQQVASFFDATPPTQSEIGAQFAEFSRSIKEILGFLRGFVRSDGALQNASIGKEQISPEIGAEIAKTAVSMVENALLSLKTDVSDAKSANFSAQAVLAQVQALKNEAEQALNAVQEAKTGLLRRWEFLQEHVFPFLTQNGPILRTLPPQSPDLPMLTGEFAPGVGPSPSWETQYSGPPESVPMTVENTGGDATYTGVLNPQAGGFYGAGQNAGAVAVAADYAQSAIEWAEHMPDTIPGSILAVTGITGQHWSSRWWATQAAALFGGQMAYLYLGPQPFPPTTTPTGGAIPVGAIYYDTGLNATYVWNGTAWEPFNTPQKSASSVLFYAATAGETNFVLTTPDMFGNAAQALLADGSQGIEVWLNGARLTPSKGAVVNDFTVTVATSTITLAEATQAGAVVAVDVLTPASAFAPSSVALVKIKIVPDGATTTFPLIDYSNNPYHSVNAAQFLVAVDGIPQNPGLDYTMTGDGNSIVFSTAPAADSSAFCVIAY